MASVESMDGRDEIEIVVDPVAVSKEFIGYLGNGHEDPQGKENNIIKGIQMYKQKMSMRIIEDEIRVDKMLVRLQTLKSGIKTTQSTIADRKARRDALAKEQAGLGPGRTGDTEAMAPDASETAQLAQSIELYERALGIEVRTAHDNAMQLVFRGLGPDRPSAAAGGADSPAVCFCTLRRRTDSSARAYEATACRPLIPDLDRLVSHFNWTDDIRGFAILLRRRFQRHFELARLVSAKLPGPVG